jgi:hypothetical protein
VRLSATVAETDDAFRGIYSDSDPLRGRSAGGTPAESHGVEHRPCLDKKKFHIETNLAAHV